MIMINLSIISFVISKITSFKAVVLNLVLTAFVINNAFQFKKQFYPSVVYISKSNTSMAVSIQHLIVYYKNFLKMMSFCRSYTFKVC